MTTNNEFMPWGTLPKVHPTESRRFLVLAPVGTLLKPLYDGDSESAALEAYRYALAHNQLPRFYERRSVVIV